MDHMTSKIVTEYSSGDMSSLFIGACIIIFTEQVFFMQWPST